MYGLVVIGSFLIRQLLLPNPFTPLGDMAPGLNLIAGLVFVPLTYWMVGFVYQSGENPVGGSLLFLFVYALNTVVSYGICLVYPLTWLMIVLGIAYLVLFVIVSIKLNSMA